MTDSHNDDLTTRVANLEREVARLPTLEHEVVQVRELVTHASNDAAAARVMAAGADHDVSEVRAELRAHTSVLNALRETQLELRETQLELRETQLEQDRKMTQGFSLLSTGMAHITELLERIEGSEQDEG